MANFDSFVMFAEMRTGSNFLEANLNALPGVSCHGELFNPYFIGQKDQMSLHGIDLAQRDADPEGFLTRLRSENSGIWGFRYFHNHDPRIFDIVCRDRRCAKIILTRNPLDSYVSWKIAQTTGQWRLTNAKHLKTARIRFDPREFTRYLDNLQQFQIRLQHRLQTSGQTGFYLSYEDSRNIDVLNGLAAYLGLAAQITALDSTLKKQNPEDLASKVENFDEMRAALARIDRFNLSRTPCFEPMRPAGIPSYTAAGSLLYLPIQPGPPQLQPWLAALGPLEGKFDRKSLRRWKHNHPGYRSFTVVSHPLLRAYRAFRQLLGQNAPELRLAMRRLHDLELPPPGTGYRDPAQHHSDFITFLQFVKSHLAGQTALKISAALVSQSAVIDGFCKFTTPDVILREARLNQGLIWLAEESGLAPPPMPAADPGHENDALNEIHSAEIDLAIRDAYGLDFERFGFSDWNCPSPARNQTGGS
jgi:LPS sulfotransferase NodH